MTQFARIIAALVRDEGPIGVGRYMALALGHPVHGYYRTRDPLGRAGDFTTAPEISQMFGELIGLWATEAWRLMGAPSRVALIELGPGRGTLMADALRAGRVVPGWLDAVSCRLVETSPVLRERQRAALAGSGASATWHDRLDEVPEGPAIVVANEFLDALPVDQFVRGRAGWHERVVGLSATGELAFGLAAAPRPDLLRPAPDGAVLELSPARDAAVAEVGARLAQAGGAALLIDYGYARSGFGETLQAVRAHAFVDPLRDPGSADLTSHVDFAAAARAAVAAGARVHGPVEQGAFLAALGIAERAERLAARAPAEAAAAAVEAALRRLVGREPGQMGSLFKVLGLSGPGLSALPGLPPFDRPVPLAAAERQRFGSGSDSTRSEDSRPC